jgi:hypothetical protein
MQDEAIDPAEIPRERLRRAEAAAYARRRLGQSVKVNTLRSWPIPYRQVGRDAVYEISDLDRFIDARLAAAPLRRALSPADQARVASWVRGRLIDWPRDNCLHCRKPITAHPWIDVRNGEAMARFHQSCHDSWRAEQERLARRALGLA